MSVVPLGDVFQGIEKLIRECHGRAEYRLPTQAEIAAMLGVSCHAVQRVLEAMARAGIVRISRRSGIRTDPRGPDPESFERARSFAAKTLTHAWERIADQLVDDIRAGSLAPGRQLPSYKSLCIRFGANYRTVRQSLVDLEKKRLIEKHKRGFRVRQCGPQQSSGTVVIIARARHPLILMNYTVSSPTFWTTFEHECVRLNVRSEVFGQDMHGNLSRWQDPATYSVDDIVRAYPVLGFIVWGHNMGRERFARLMADLRTTGKPVSVLQETETLSPTEMASVCGSSSRVAIFPLAVDRGPGEAVARFLLDKGHRTVALFSFRHPVFQVRAGGIRDLFRPVRAHLHELWTDFPVTYSDMLSDRFSPGNGPYVQAERDIATLDKKLSSRFEDYTHMDRTFVDRMLARDFAFRKWQPHFEQALADPAITAWIGCNDMTALAALRFMRKRSVDVPGDVSVIGFDNHHESFTRSLCSFDFNCRAATIAMLNHIIDPPAVRGKQARIHYTPGFVVERSSTRAIRQS